MEPDPALTAALATAIGHPPPFAGGEVATVEELTVVHARSLDGITDCAGLRRLTLVGCELEHRDLFEGLSVLNHLRIVGCRIASTYPFLDCDDLDTREIVLTALPSLAEADEAGIYAGPDLFEGVPHSLDIHEYLAGLGMVRSEYERRLCVRVWEATGDVYGRGLLVRPGLPRVTENLFDAVRISAPDLERALDQQQDPFAVYPFEAPGVEALLAPESANAGWETRKWLHTNEVWGDDAIAIDRFAARFPSVPLDVSDLASAAAYEHLVPYSWGLRAKLLRWSLLRECPPVRLGRFPGETWTIGRPDAEPDPADLLVASGLIVIGRSDTGRTLAYELADRGHVAVLDEAAFAAELAARPSLLPAFRIGDTVPRVETAYESQALLLDDISALTDMVRFDSSPPVITPSLLGTAVLRELRRLGAVTPSEPAATPLAAFEGCTWPRDRTLRTREFDWTLRWVYAPWPGNRQGIAYEEEGQYYWVVDLSDERDDPMVYRIDHDDEDRVPDHGSSLSEMLAELRVE